ncbi:MAG: hypothetical protein SO072_02415 [Dysosmobacter sp.]|nr:hypothetical protein [Dysosmobacter sp.]
MAGKAKFDKESAFKSIIGAGWDPEAESTEQQLAAKGKNAGEANQLVGAAHPVL